VTLSFPFHRKLNTKALNSFITVAGVFKKEHASHGYGGRDGIFN